MEERVVAEIEDTNVECGHQVLASGFWLRNLNTNISSQKPIAKSQQRDPIPEIHPVLKTLDRYIIKQFLGTFFFILVTIMLIAVVFDISEKTEDFATMKASGREIVFNFYLNFIIYYSNLFSGLLIRVL